jgi:hypothetical protein
MSSGIIFLLLQLPLGMGSLSGLQIALIFIQAAIPRCRKIAKPRFADKYFFSKASFRRLS